MRTLPILVMVVTATLGLLKPSAEVQAQSPTRVSVGFSGGTQGDNHSHKPAISADGRFVAFESFASNLVPGDSNGRQDIFVHDRTTRETTRVSVSSAGVQSNGNSFRPAISSDGRFVVFDSDASNLVPGDSNGRFDIFVHDRTTGDTTRVSVSSAGIQGNSDSLDSAISADGQIVAFASNATNLVPGDTNRQRDIFVHDRTTGQTRRVSVGFAGGVQGNGSSFNPALSGDGRFVAFESSASNLVPNDSNGHRDIFVHDRATEETTRVSVGFAGGVQGNDHSFHAALSADGRFVAFHSSSSNLVPNDSNATTDVFVHDRTATETTRVSIGAAGGVQGNAGSFDAVISADGRFVAFESSASNLVPNDSNATKDIFVHDRTTGQTSRVSVGAAGGVQGNRGSFDAAISGDGRFVAFESDATNLVPTDTNARRDIFVRDRGAVTGAGFSGAWQRLDQDCSSRGLAPRCRLRGALVVTNPGTETAEASLLQFFLSADEILDPDDVLLDEVLLRQLRPGKTWKQGLNVIVDGDASGKFVIAVLDATNQVAEVNEDNNIVVSPPIP